MNKYLVITLLGCAPVIILTLASGVSYCAMTAAPVKQSPTPASIVQIKKDLAHSQNYSRCNKSVMAKATATRLHLNENVKDLKLDLRGATPEVQEAYAPMRRVESNCQRISELLEIPGALLKEELEKLEGWKLKYADQGGAEIDPLMAKVLARIEALKLTREAFRALELVRDLKSHERVVEILRKFILQEKKITNSHVQQSVRALYNPARFEQLINDLDKGLRHGDLTTKQKAVDSYTANKKEILPLTVDQQHREDVILRRYQKELEAIAFAEFSKTDPVEHLDIFLERATELITSYPARKVSVQNRVEAELKKLLPTKSDKGFAELKFVTLSFNKEKAVGYFVKSEGDTQYWYWKEANEEQYRSRGGGYLLLKPKGSFLESEPQPILEVKLVKEWNDERNKALLTISRVSTWQHLLSVCQSAEKQLKAQRESEKKEKSRIRFEDVRDICKKVISHRDMLDRIFR